MTTTITILVAILNLGVVHIIYDIICITRQEQKVEEFIQILQKFIAKHKVNKDNSKEVAIIMAHGEDISNIMEEDEYNSPIIAIQCQIRNNNTYSIEDEVRKVYCNAPQAMKRLSDNKRATYIQLINPFIWFYRGVEVLSYIVLGYFVNTGTIEYRGKAWNTFNTFFTLITGIATLVGLYLQIKGS